MKENNYVEELKRMAEEDVDEAGENKENEKEKALKLDLSGSLEYSIKVTVKDMRGFVLRHSYGNFSGWFGVIISLAAIVMLMYGWDKYGNAERIALCILGSLFTIVQPLQLSLKAKRQVTSNAMFNEPITYNLCKDGVVVRQHEERADISWDDVFKIVDKKKAVYIYTSPVSAIILPKNQIENVPELISFLKGKKSGI